MEQRSKKHIIIVGGGITGLSAAYYTKKKFAELECPVDITLIEKGVALGGKIQTLYRDSCVIEKGPDSFLARKMPIIELTMELGLEQELVATNPAANKSYILKNRKFHRIPAGMVLGIPTQIKPFMKTGLLSPQGKLRAIMDLVLPRGNKHEDESLGDFIERRLGKEVHTYIAEPLLAGIYAGDTYSLSLQATFPQFQQMEQKYRSLILGMMKDREQVRRAKHVPEIVKNNVFLTYRKGLKTLVDAIVHRLDDVNIIRGHSVITVRQGQYDYFVNLEDGQRIGGDAIIVTLPPFQTAQLLDDIPETAELNAIRYVSVANVVLAFNKKDISFPLDATGFVIPRTEKRFITACTWTSTKWLHTAPDDIVLLRSYVGRAGEEDWMKLSDDEILRKVRSELADLMQIQATPLFHEITRLYDSMPQYPLGHLELVERVRQALASKRPGIYITGAGYDGVGLPDCIRQGKEAAEYMLNYLQK